MKRLLILLLVSANCFSQIREAGEQENVQKRIGEAAEVSLIYNAGMGQYNFTYQDANYKKLIEIVTFSFANESDLDVLYNALKGMEPKTFEIHEGTLYVETKGKKVRMAFSDIGERSISKPTEWMRPDDVDKLFGK